MKSGEAFKQKENALKGHTTTSKSVTSASPEQLPGIRRRKRTRIWIEELQHYRTVIELVWIPQSDFDNLLRVN